MKHYLALASGPLAALIILLSGFTDNVLTVSMAAITVWIALWWITEALPMAVTALLPIVLFPLSGIMGTADVATTYTNDIIFLYVCGFFFAFAMERWGLHTRVATGLIYLLGQSERQLLLGFLLASFCISMFISNVATTLALMPPALALIHRFEGIRAPERARKFASGLLIGIAYAASLGGMATPVGTAPNLIFWSSYHKQFPELEPLNFAQWVAFALPTALLILFACYFWLASRHTQVHTQSSQMVTPARQPWSFEEATVAALFALLVLLWVFRADLTIGGITLQGWAGLLGNPKIFTDATAAVAVASLLFMIPSKGAKGQALLRWSDCERIPFDVLLLFGGGFALAAGFDKSGLSNWLGSQLALFNGLDETVWIVGLCFSVAFFSEIMSNTAAVQLLLPILAAAAPAVGVHPLLLLLPATLSASLGFMLPVATPPNTIVFGYKRIQLREMLSAGLWLDVIGVAILSISMLTLGRWVFGV
jgi:sodium-dependent dicarboxylate transporter 2/3/5